MKENKISRRTLLKCGAGLGAAALAAGCSSRPTAASGASSGQFATSASQSEKKPQEEKHMSTKQSQYRAMWFSYLDWAIVDFSSEETFRAGVGTALDHCVELGLNTFIAQVRPFADALYQSTLFPWSHVCTGTQGQAPGFDPLDILVTEAHGRGLSLEAWINPYRIQLNATMPPALAENGLETLHPEWCVSANEGIYLNPAIPEAADYVISGIQEILDHYAVDGIHFDDYFYPTTQTDIDAVQFAAFGAGSLEDWRRENVTSLVRGAYNAVKSKDPTLRFGISPQGNPDNNYSGQYSDVSAWMASGEAIVDYICPQIYWGYHYTLKSGSDRFAFEKITAEWLAMPRDDNVHLYFGLGAYRIGDGDGGNNSDSVTQWQSGHELADMAADLKDAGADGYVLYRYASLYTNETYADLAAAEAAALATENTAQS